MLGYGEPTDFATRAQAFRIGLVERDVLARVAARDGSRVIEDAGPAREASGQGI